MGHEGDTGHVERWNGKMAQLVAKATVLRKTLTSTAQTQQIPGRRWYATRKDDNRTESIGLPACAIGEAGMIAQLLRRSAAWTGRSTEWEDDRRHGDGGIKLQTRKVLPARTVSFRIPSSAARRASDRSISSWREAACGRNGR